MRAAAGIGTGAVALAVWIWTLWRWPFRRGGRPRIGARTVDRLTRRKNGDDHE